MTGKAEKMGWKLLSLGLMAGVALCCGAPAAFAQQAPGLPFNVYDVCGVSPKDGKAYLDTYQLDVFDERGVYTFCGRLQREGASVIFTPQLTLNKTISWTEYECMKDGAPYFPDKFKARCLFRDAEVGQGAYCKRDGDKNGDGLVDGLRDDIPVSLPLALGYVVVGSRSGGGASVIASYADPDTSALRPDTLGAFGNMVLSGEPTPTAIVSRSYAHDLYYADPKKDEYGVVTHTRKTDLFRNYYVSAEDLRAGARTIKIGPCTDQ